MAETIAPTHVFFAGGSWGCAFYIGVYKALQEKYGLNVLSKWKFAGNSAGAFIATFAVLGFDWTNVESLYLDCLNQASEHGVFGKASIYHNLIMDKIFKADAVTKLNNKLFIGVTHFIDEYELISQWTNNDEVRDCIHASMHIPYYCTHINKIQTKKGYSRCIDGSLGKEFHRFNKTTLVVTATDNSGDISSEPPLMFLKDCYEPNLEKYYKMRDNGYYVMNKWNGKYKCDEYNNYTKRKYVEINMKKIVAFCLWVARILEEIQIKRIVFIAVCILFCKKYGKLGCMVKCIVDS
eukprot:105954_1